MSGSALAPWSLQPNARANGFRLAGIVGCQQQDEELVLECLQVRAVTPNALVLRKTNYVEWMMTLFVRLLPWNPSWLASGRWFLVAT